MIKDGNIENVSRQAIASRFAAGEFPVIICSDAASEGLNLQSANVLINVDVPWNPARVLQRFGRIDRFGQKKSTLHFYNLFYPGTIEDRMYTRLHMRNAEFRELLGTTPDITTKSHLQDLQLVIADEPIRSEYKNSLLHLEPLHNVRPHEVILSRLQLINAFSVSANTIEFNGTLYPYSTDQMDGNYLNLCHLLFDAIPVDFSNFSGLFNGEKTLLYICKIEGLKAYPLIGLSDILDQLILRRWQANQFFGDSLRLIIFHLSSPHF